MSKLFIKSIKIAVVALLLGALLLPALPVYASPGWLAGEWDQRVKLTIDNTDIDEVLTDFPVLVYLSASSGRNSDNVSFVFNELTLDANRKKIAVTTSDGITECYVEIEKWDDTNEQAWLWVKVPSIASSTDTILYLYYDVNHADNDAYVGDTNSTPAENVWDADFLWVFHMRDGVDNANIYDSTGNNKDGVKLGANEPVEAAGKIAEGQDFDGDNDEIIPVATDMPVAGTWEAICKLDVKPSDSHSMCPCSVNYWHSVNDRFYMRSTNQYFYAPKITAGVYRYIALTWTDKTNQASAEMTFDLTEYPPVSPNAAAITGLTAIGNGSQGGFDGLIDEFRFSQIKRTYAWKKATKETCWDDLVAFGSEQAIDYPTVISSAATEISATNALLHGETTNLGGDATITSRGFVWDNVTHGDPGHVTPGDSDYYHTGYGTGNWGLGVFESLTGTVASGTTWYWRACVKNTRGWSYSAERSFLTKPAAPTDVAATDGVHTDKVVVTWTKSTGATDYQVYRDGVALGWLGDVNTHDDNGADAPVVIPGIASASDGTSGDYSTLLLTGVEVNNGTSHVYKVRAKNATGESADSNTDAGYRGHGILTYGWFRSAADSDAGYGFIPGATTNPYNDTDAVGYPDGRWYVCKVNATGAAEQSSTRDRGYKSVAPTVTSSTADNITTTSATLHGEITSTGGVDATVRGFEWDTDSGVPYANEWHEDGSFGVGAFGHGLTDLPQRTTIHWRAYATNPLGSGYSAERSFTTEYDPRDPNLVYLELRPDLDEVRIRGNAGIPTSILVGTHFGYSLPVWTPASNEELYFLLCMPDRWNGESDILVHVKTATSDNQSGNVYALELAWDKVTPNVVEAIPTGAPYTVDMTRTVYSGLQYACYLDWFAIDYDIESDDPIAVDDTLALRFRRFGASDNLTSELIIVEFSVLFARGDLLGEEEGMTEALVLLFFGCLGLGLLVTGFTFRQFVLAFLAAFVFLGLSIVGWASTEAAYDAYWLIGFLGLLLCLVSFVCGILIARDASRRGAINEMRLEREFPPPAAPLSEEDAYSKMLDEEISQSRRVGGPARRKQMLDRATRQLYGLDRPPKD